MISSELLATDPLPLPPSSWMPSLVNAATLLFTTARDTQGIIGASSSRPNPPRSTMVHTQCTISPTPSVNVSLSLSYDGTCDVDTPPIASGGTPWRFRERQYDTRTREDRPLVAVLLVAKIQPWALRSVVSRLRSAPVTRPEIPDWNCIAWVRMALDELRGSYPSIRSWEELTVEAEAFGAEKTKDFLDAQDFSFVTRSRDVRARRGSVA